MPTETQTPRDPEGRFLWPPGAHPPPQPQKLVGRVASRAIQEAPGSPPGPLGCHPSDISLFSRALRVCMG